MPRIDRRQNAHAGGNAREMIGERNAHGLGLVHVREQAQQPAHGLPHRVIARPVRRGTTVAEARDRAIDESGVALPHRIPSKAEAIQRPRAQILDHHIRLFHQAQRMGLAFGGFEIQRHALLVAVHRAEGGVVTCLAPTAEGITGFRRLHLDDVRAEVAEQHAGIGPADIAGELDDLDTLQCAHGSAFSLG